MPCNSQFSSYCEWPGGQGLLPDFHCGAEEEFTFEGWELERLYMCRLKWSHQIGKICPLGLKGSTKYFPLQTHSQGGWVCSICLGPEQVRKPLRLHRIQAGEQVKRDQFFFSCWTLLQTKEWASAPSLVAWSSCASVSVLQSCYTKLHFKTTSCFHGQGHILAPWLWTCYSSQSQTHTALRKATHI